MSKTNSRIKAFQSASNPDQEYEDAFQGNCSTVKENLRKARKENPDLLVKIARANGISVSALKRARHGRSGLGLHDDNLVYTYPGGLKISYTSREPRTGWLYGKASAPWRMDRVKPETTTIYLTECENDAIALIGCGLGSNKDTVVVASPYATFPKPWAKRFAGKHVILCPTSDSAEQAKVAGYLQGYALSVKITSKESVMSSSTR